MAIASGTIFEVRASATTGNVNGGGFNTANANFMTDLAAANGDTATPDVSSATYAFVAGDVGSYVYISSGTDWVVGWYPITAVNTGVATLDASVGAVVLSIGPQGLVTRNTSVGCASVATPSSGTFTVDYSQQDAAALTLTDLTCTAGSTTVTSSTGGFTDAMIGNLVNLTALTGTGAIVGWYEIVDYTDGNNVVLDRTPTDGSNNITAGTFYVGGAGRLNGLENTFKTMLPASHKVFIKTGTYTFSASAVSASTKCTATLQGFWYGYTSNRGDDCTGNDRPLFAMGANQFKACQYTSVYNIIGTGTADAFWAGAVAAQFYNCKVLNSSTTADRAAISIRDNPNYHTSCEAVSQNGFAIYLGSSVYPSFSDLYIHDSKYGIYGSYSTSSTSFSILAGNLYHLRTYQADEAGCSYNIFYGRQSKYGTGLYMDNANSPRNRLGNNIFYGLTTAIYITTGKAESNLSYYNNFYNNTTDNTNWTKGSTDMAIDPVFSGITEIAGTTATTAASVLTDTSKDFTAADLVTDNVDYLHVVSGTDVTVACYLITSHDATTLTTNNALGTSSAGNVVYWINHGGNFTPASTLVGVGFPNFTNTTGGLTTSYPTVGPVTPQASSGGGGAWVF